MKDFAMGNDELREQKIGLVVMASGLGKRFGGNKLMEMLGGKPLIKWILDVTEDIFDKRVVVTRNASIKALCDELNIDCILHELPNRNDTVRLGLGRLMKDVDYCFFTPGDQPLISRKSFTKLIDEAKCHKDSIVRTCWGDSASSPMGFPKCFFNELLNLPEKKGGGFVANNHQELVRLVAVSNEYEIFDIDTVSDLEMAKIFKDKGQ